MLERRPNEAIRMLASLSRWLKRMTDLAESLSLTDVEPRLVFSPWEELKARGHPRTAGAARNWPTREHRARARRGPGRNGGLGHPPGRGRAREDSSSGGQQQSGIGPTGLDPKESG